MDPVGSQAPLFEVSLVLQEPDLTFNPPLEGKSGGSFTELIQEMVNDINQMAGLVERISPNQKNNYQVK